MRPGSVIVDVAVDQGGCVATIRPTTHAEPTYVLHGVIHYGVTNMPALVPRTSTFALTNATLPYALRLAGGVDAAFASDPGLGRGLNTKAGKVVTPGRCGARPASAAQRRALVGPDELSFGQDVALHGREELRLRRLPRSRSTLSSA